MTKFLYSCVLTLHSRKGITALFSLIFAYLFINIASCQHDVKDSTNIDLGIDQQKKVIYIITIVKKTQKKIYNKIGNNPIFLTIYHIGRNKQCMVLLFLVFACFLCGL